MNYISTTELRTKSSELVKLLKKGGAVSLIHRSKIIGIISPKKEPEPLKKVDADRIKRLAEKLNLPKFSYEERERNYREHLEKKYGKNFS